MDDITNRIRKEAALVTHPKHKQVLLDALAEIERLRAAAVGATVGADVIRAAEQAFDCMCLREKGWTEAAITGALATREPSPFAKKAVAAIVPALAVRASVGADADEFIKHVPGQGITGE